MAENAKEKEYSRKYVEGLLEKFLKMDVLDNIDWIRHANPLSDLRDVALGYVIGLILGKYECNCLLDEIRNGTELKVKNVDIVMKVLNEKLPDIIDKIEKELLAPSSL